MNTSLLSGVWLTDSAEQETRETRWWQALQPHLADICQWQHSTEPTAFSHQDCDILVTVLQRPADLLQLAQMALGKPHILLCHDPEALIIQQCDLQCHKCPQFTGEQTLYTQAIRILRGFDVVICFDLAVAGTLFEHFHVVPTLFDPHVDEHTIAVMRDMLLSLTDRNPQTLRLLWLGEHLYYHSLAIINRELMLYLLAPERQAESHIKIDIRIINGYQRMDWELLRRYPQLSWRTSSSSFAHPPDFFISHIWPPRFEMAPLNGKWIVIQPWEFGPVPQAWVYPVQHLIDELWVPSTYVKDCFVESGAPPSRIQVIPNGLAPEFMPQVPPKQLNTAKSFRFLFVGGSIYRKGFDILMQAYLSEFSAADDVCLVIKDFGAKSFYSEGNLGQELKALMERDDRPDILLLKDNLNEDEMPSLYAACQCYVHPYRGEGFGMPIAEAMAVGLPVIVTDYGACLDFCNPDNAYLIPAKVVFYGPDFLAKYPVCGLPRLAHPDIKRLQELMREVYQNPQAAAQKGARASVDVRQHLGWHFMGAQVLERFLALRTQQPRRLLAVNVDTLNQYQLDMDRQDWVAAEKKLRYLLLQEPQHVDWLLRLLQVLVAQQQWDAAVNTLLQLLPLEVPVTTLAALATQIAQARAISLPLLAKMTQLAHVYWDLPAANWVLPIELSAHEAVIYQGPPNRDEHYCIYVGDGSKPAPQCDHSVALVNWNQPLPECGTYSDIWATTKRDTRLSGFSAISPLGFAPALLEAEPAELESRADFLALLEWENPGWKQVLGAYLKAFKGRLDQPLWLKFYSTQPVSEDHMTTGLSLWLESLPIPEQGWPDIVWVEQDISRQTVASLMKAASFCLLHANDTNSEYLAYLAALMECQPMVLGDLQVNGLPWLIRCQTAEILQSYLTAPPASPPVPLRAEPYQQKQRIQAFRDHILVSDLQKQLDLLKLNLVQPQ